MRRCFPTTRAGAARRASITEPSAGILAWNRNNNAGVQFFAPRRCLFFFFAGLAAALAFFVALGTVARAAALPSAVLADEQNRQRQQHKNHQQNQKTLQIHVVTSQGVTQVRARPLHSVPQKRPPMQVRIAAAPPRRPRACCPAPAAQRRWPPRRGCTAV